MLNRIFLPHNGSALSCRPRKPSAAAAELPCQTLPDSGKAQAGQLQRLVRQRARAWDTEKEAPGLYSGKARSLVARRRAMTASPIWANCFSDKFILRRLSVS